MRHGAFLLLLVLGCAPLGGCGAFLAGAAGGAVGAAVVENAHRPPPPAYYGPY